MRKTIKGKITVQTIMYLLVALVICELVSVVTLNANMTSQSKLYINAEAQKELSDAATSVNENLQKITYSSENMSQETKEVLESVNSLQETMQSFQV